MKIRKKNSLNRFDSFLFRFHYLHRSINYLLIRILISPLMYHRNRNVLVVSVCQQSRFSDRFNLAVFLQFLHQIIQQNE